MRFFQFTQNNSGGSFDFDHDAGISTYVIVQAYDAQDANRRAEDIGLYFDGCDDGRDCSCCGDRWIRSYSDGAATAMIYDKPVGEWDDQFILKHASGKPYAYVHYADGRREAFSRSVE